MIEQRAAIIRSQSSQAKYHRGQRATSQTQLITTVYQTQNLLGSFKFQILRAAIGKILVSCVSRLLWGRPGRPGAPSSQLWPLALSCSHTARAASRKENQWPRRHGTLVTPKPAPVLELTWRTVRECEVPIGRSIEPDASSKVTAVAPPSADLHIHIYTHIHLLILTRYSR